MTLALASCDDYDLPNVPGQTNPEPEIFENSGLNLVQAATDLNLKDANAANSSVKVAEISDLVNFPAAYDLQLDLQVSGDENFSKAQTIATTIDADTVFANPDLLNGAIQATISKKPGDYTVYGRIAAYAVKGNTKVRLGGLDKYYGPFQYNVKTLDPEKVIEDEYYLVGGFCNWDLSKAVKMNNTGGDVSPYDNPEFAVKMSVTNAESVAGWTWKVVPGSSVAAGIWDGALGCRPSADSNLAGKLVVAPEAETEAGVVNLEGDILITVNIEEDSYTVNYAFEALWIGPTKRNTMPVYTQNYINYQGVAYMTGLWYCGTDAAFTGLEFKQDAEKPAEDSENGLTRTGGLSSTGSTLRTPVRNQLYWVDINLVQLTYSITALESLSVIGGGNGWDLATAPKLTPSSDHKVWTAKGVTIGEEFKINANGAWDIDFGQSGAGSDNVYNITYKGSNIMVANPGVYDVEVNFGVFPYTVTLK